jgi:type I restriction enzyme S subunit
MADYIEVEKRGTTFHGISQEAVERFRLPLPAPTEQRAIINYLDAETARIDALIAKKQQLIDLLELHFLERCRAMTTPLGMPFAPLRWTTAVRTGTTPSAEASWMMSDDGSVEWFTPGDVGERLTLHPSARRLDPVALSSREVPAIPAGSTLLVGIGATAGKVAFMSRAGSSNQQMTAVVPGERLEPRFLAWQLWARGGEMRATAPYTTLPILNNDFVKSFQICIPTLEAQREIVDCVDRLDRLTTALSRKLGRQTRLLAEHRRALITSAVAKSRQVANSERAESAGSR